MSTNPSACTLRGLRPHAGKGSGNRPRPVSPDPDDDVVLATALTARAELIVSRDKHLRNLKHFHRIPILSAMDALHIIVNA